MTSSKLAWPITLTVCAFFCGVLACSSGNEIGDGASDAPRADTRGDASAGDTATFDSPTIDAATDARGDIAADSTTDVGTDVAVDAATDAPIADTGNLCATVRCSSGQVCCPATGMCYPAGCLACCMPRVDAGPGGCTSNADCSAGDYCAAATCAGPGTCTVRPMICTAIFDPVCGCDGRTYSNACNAAGAGVRVESRGSCTTGADAGGTSCGSTMCPAGEVCCSGTGRCYNPACLSCCMVVDRCATVRCASGFLCCPATGTCYDSRCLACCRAMM